MMMLGTACAGLSMSASALAYTIQPGAPPLRAPSSPPSLSSTGACTSSFSGTLSWALASELPSSRLSVLTVSLATGVNYFFSCESATGLELSLFF